MPDIDVEQDLTQVNTQLEQLVTQLNQVNNQREQLTQQIHNLNGIAMYLRGKQEAGEDGVQPAEDLELTEEYPEDMLTRNA
jgi:peptidoglycan hydrolase CwlO-like protein